MNKLSTFICVVSFVFGCSVPTIKPIKIDICNGNYSVFLYQNNCESIPEEISISKEELNRLQEIKKNSSDLCIPVTITKLYGDGTIDGYLKSSINILCSI